MLKQLVYLSYTTENFDFEKDIDDILSKAREFNPKHDITGMLVYRDEMFIQLIEGPPEDIQSLYGKISLDMRHSNISIIVYQNTEERLFPDWTMGYRDAGEFNINLINDILSLKDLQTATREGRFVSSDKIMNLLKLFRYHKDDKTT